MKNNILVQYQGGGYSGCSWEWNYFYINKDGVFYDLYSSGREAITNKQDGQYLVDEDTDHTFIYDVTSSKDIETFAAKTAAIHTTGVLQWFEDNPQDGIEFFAVCADCGKHIDCCAEIALAENKLLCQECSCVGSCDCCDCYVGETGIICTSTYAVEDKYMNQAAEKMEADGYDYVCEACLIYHAAHIEQADHEDLLYSSLAMG